MIAVEITELVEALKELARVQGEMIKGLESQIEKKDQIIELTEQKFTLMQERAGKALCYQQMAEKDRDAHYNRAQELEKERVSLLMLRSHHCPHCGMVVPAGTYHDCKETTLTAKIEKLEQTIKTLETNHWENMTKWLGILGWTCTTPYQEESLIVIDSSLVELINLHKQNVRRALSPTSVTLEFTPSYATKVFRSFLPVEVRRSLA